MDGWGVGWHPTGAGRVRRKGETLLRLAISPASLLLGGISRSSFHVAYHSPIYQTTTMIRSGEERKPTRARSWILSGIPEEAEGRCAAGAGTHIEPLLQATRLWTLPRSWFAACRERSVSASGAPAGDRDARRHSPRQQKCRESTRRWPVSGLRRHQVTP